MGTLRESAFAQAKQTRMVYTAQLAAGTSLEEALKPEFWVHIAKKLRPCDQIELIPEDMAFYAKAIVIDADSLSATLKVIERVSLEEEAGKVSSIDQTEHEVRWGGPHDKFRVVRKSDGAVLARGFTSKATAFQHINNMKPKAA